MENESPDDFINKERFEKLKKLTESAHRACECCGILDDFITMYVGIKENGDNEIICDKCTQDHKDEYKKIISVTDFITECSKDD